MIFVDAADECTVPKISGGSVTPRSTIRPGSTYTVTCNADHTLSGPNTVSCTEDGGRAKLSDLPSCNQGKFYPAVFSWLNFVVT